ncbi:MAG: hypothetical protein LPK58_06300 [Gammaproteobacteria bacterium]|nr:hypothetical protein [Gammaproteobacteria bacterium]
MTSDMLQKILELRERSVYFLEGSSPAVYYLVDRDVQGVLINTPPFDPATLEALIAIAPLKFLYFPSRRGARDVDRWREASGAEAMAFEAEVPAIDGAIDIKLDRKSKFTRTMDFLPMAGVTEGSCVLRCRNKPGILFFGPVLSPGADGWPTLAFHEDDYSMESRMFGALGLQDVAFDYAFTDVFEPGTTQFGPGAAEAVNRRIAEALD